MVTLTVPLLGGIGKDVGEMFANIVIFRKGEVKGGCSTCIRNVDLV